MSFGISYTNTVNGERYVYYERLWDDDIVMTGLMGQQYKSRDLYKKVTNSLNYRITEGSNAAKIAKYFFQLRDAEFQKELRLLQTKFGYTITKSYNDPDSDKKSIGADLIKGFNTTLRLKDVVKRNLALITETQGQKQLITFFSSYFEQILKERWGEIAEKIINEAIDDNFEESSRNVLDREIPIIVREALIYMFEVAKTESGISDGDELQGAYKELLPYLKDYTNQIGNDFVQSFIRQYNLQEQTNILSKDIVDSQSVKNRVKEYKYNNNYTINVLGGLAAENMSTFMANVLIDKLEKTSGKNVKYSSTQTGRTEQKADIIFTFNMPTDTISTWVENETFGKRKKNVEAVKKLQQGLEQFDEGFIVYVNSKNYSLNSDMFKLKNGFSAGESISLNTWDDIMHAVNKKGRDLIFSAMQLIPGAIGNPPGGDNKLEEVSTMFARAISLALFDDFDTIGTINKGADSIHLLDLNGIYFPLSFYYDLLGDAFLKYSQEEEVNIKKLISVNFTLPKSILYPTMEEQREAEQNGIHTWRKQQMDALNLIKVQYHFLGSFKQIIQELNIEL